MQKLLTTNIFVLSLLVIIVSKPIKIDAQIDKYIHDDLRLPFETESNETVTYSQMIDFLNVLAASSHHFYLDTLGWSENGVWIPMLIISKDDPSHEINNSEKLRLWLNNGIHPGESEGIDATLALIRNYLFENKWESLIEELVLIIIPCYNVDGMLLRNSTSRVNQNGPNSYGFRANAKNLDLNRDFIKMKSSEAKSFNQKYATWRPHLFLDNHTSNGADYQHTMTLIPTNKEKFHPDKSKFWTKVFLSNLYDRMDKEGYPTVPYVQGLVDGDPFNGIQAFIDHPRYSSGYAALHGSLSIMSETHMLKPFLDRVKSTYVLMEIWIDLALTYKKELIRLSYVDDNYWSNQDIYPLIWTIDKNYADTIEFRGYAMTKRYSSIAERDIRLYDRSKPITKKIPYFNSITSVQGAIIPKAYIIPRSQSEIIERLRLNQIQMDELPHDSLMNVEYYIFYQSQISPLFEGQPYHRSLNLSIDTMTIKIEQGSLIVPTAQVGIKYILETLEPQAEDSFARWNFFDAYLQRKEYYSDYLFESIAAQILETDQEIDNAWSKKSGNVHDGQSNNKLQFIYEKSIYAEPQFQRYPIYRLR